MTWAQGAATVKTVMGNKRANFGGFTQGNGDTGGAFATGLSRVEFFHCTGLKSVSVSGGTVTATTLDPGGAQTGYWIAFGY